MLVLAQLLSKEALGAGAAWKSWCLAHKTQNFSSSSFKEKFESMEERQGLEANQLPQAANSIALPLRRSVWAEQDRAAACGR